MRRLTYLLALLITAGPLCAKPIPQSAQTQAESMNAVVNSQMGSAEKIRHFAAEPLTSDKQMSTLDGQTQFDFKLQCKGSNQFLKMMVQPQSGGRLTLRNIEQDTSMDGNIDTVLSPNYAMTGICANGFLNCTSPNTGQGCTSYQWIANSQGQLGTLKSPLSDMGGCYCISGQCGSNLAWNNLDIILRDLAVGASGALTKINPFYTIAAMNIDDVTVTVSGADGASCSDNQEMNNIKNADYRKNPQQLNTDGFAASESNVWYQHIENSAKHQDFNVSQCAIQRNINHDLVNIDDIIAFDSGSSSSGGVYMLDNDSARIVLGRVGDNYWPGSCTYYTEKTSFYIKRPELIKSAILKRAKYDDWIQVAVNGQHIWNGPYGNWSNIGSRVPGRCELTTSWDQSINKNFTHVFNKEGKYDFEVRVEVSGNGEGYILGDIEVEPKCEVLDDIITNGCRVQQADDDCTLLEEVVDGVTVFRNGHSTGLSQLPASGGVFCGQHEYRDWFKRARKYKCKNKTPYNFDEGMKRLENIKSTLNDKGEFVDRRTTPSGAIVFENGVIDVFENGGATCLKTCKTKKKRPVEIALSAPTSDKQLTDDAYDSFYHQCTIDNLCPTGDGEEIVTDCACLNTFAEAATAMQVLRLAGQDMICSDDTRGKLNAK